MPKEKLNTRPLLFISQPEFEVKNFKMQQKYQFKLDEIESTLKKNVEDEYEEEIFIEKINAIKLVDEQIQETPVVIPVKQVEAVNHTVEQAVIHVQKKISEKQKQIGLLKEESVNDGFNLEVSDVREETMREEVNSLEETVNEYTIDENNKEIVLEDGELHGEFNQNNAQEENIDVKQQKKEEIRAMITRLAHYPNVIERPFCEAVINGTKVALQIMSKRGDSVKVKIGRSIIKCAILDIEDLLVLPKKGL